MYGKYLPGTAAAFTYFQRFHHSPLPSLLRSMLLRSAASVLLRTSTDISTLFPVFTVRFVRQSLRYPPRHRPFSTSACLCKRNKKKSLWLQLAEGQTMDGNIEQILAPLRLAVKEQVTLNYLTISSDNSSICLFIIKYVFMASDTVTLSLACHASRLLIKLSMNEEL